MKLIPHPNIPAQQVTELLERYGFTHCKQAPENEAWLGWDEDLQLCLFLKNGKSLLSAQVNWVDGQAKHRRQFGGGRGQPLAKAIGLKRGVNPRVLDATAGLGRDAFVLASLGCDVQLNERVPAIHALLSHGLTRAELDADLSEIISRISLHPCQSSIDLMHHMDQPPEVIYLDPMYPERKKSALVKQDMRVFKTLVGADEDEAELLNAALELATHRVVVKRPKSAPPLAGPEPSTDISSSSTRYDVYAKKALSP